MYIKINKDNRRHLYIQVKKQIIYILKNVSLRSGTKITTERELANLLCISRNTVSSAYNELEDFLDLVINRVREKNKIMNSINKNLKFLVRKLIIQSL